MLVLAAIVVLGLAAYVLVAVGMVAAMLDRLLVAERAMWSAAGCLSLAVLVMLSLLVIGVTT